MQRWKITGIVATSVIVLSLPIYGLRHLEKNTGGPEEPAVTFVTSKACAQCHQKEYTEWLNSHHAKAMAVATNETVLGVFNDTIFVKDGVQSRFYRKDGGFFVYTRGP